MCFVWYQFYQFGLNYGLEYIVLLGLKKSQNFKPWVIQLIKMPVCRYAVQCSRNVMTVALAVGVS